MYMDDLRIEQFHGNHVPSREQLDAATKLYQSTVQIFDPEGKTERDLAIGLHADPERYRDLLKNYTLLLASERGRIAGLLEWEPRENGNVTLALVRWLLVSEPRDRNEVALELHNLFERECVPDVVRDATGKRVLQLVAVHMNDPALPRFREWGYSEDGIKQPDEGRRLFMVKEPLTNGEKRRATA